MTPNPYNMWVLKRIRIRNYKNLRDTGDMELGPINLVVGPNASGKTALWEVLRRFKRAAGNEDWPKIWSDYNRVVSDMDGDKTISLEMDFTIGDNALSYALDFQAGEILREEMSVDNEEVFLREGGEIYNKASDTRTRWLPGRLFFVGSHQKNPTWERALSLGEVITSSLVEADKE